MCNHPPNLVTSWRLFELKTVWKIDIFVRCIWIQLVFDIFQKMIFFWRSSEILRWNFGSQISDTGHLAVKMLRSRYFGRNDCNHSLTGNSLTSSGTLFLENCLKNRNICSASEFRSLFVFSKNDIFLEFFHFLRWNFVYRAILGIWLKVEDNILLDNCNRSPNLVTSSACYFDKKVLKYLKFWISVYRIQRRYCWVKKWYLVADLSVHPLTMKISALESILENFYRKNSTTGAF